MRPLALGEIVGLDAYEALRDDYRARVMAWKRQRRLAVGDRVSLLFENRETIRFQVQEMIRVERLREAARIQHELDVYNELVPGDDQLSATLMIEITEPDRIRAELDRLRGIDGCVFLELGQGADTVRIPARFDAGQLDDERISAVHYLAFALGPQAAAHLRNPATPAQVAIDHPHYRARAPLPDALRAELVADLAGDPQPLLVPPPGGSAADERGGRVLAERGRVRLLQPEAPAGRGHVVIEPVPPVASLLEADASLAAELLEAVKEQAREVLARHGACRVTTDLHAPQLRWHVYAPER